MTICQEVSFKMAKARLYSQLREEVPDIYQLAERLMPNAEYAPDVLLADHQLGVMARADGLFSIDGSDFELFRWVYLHELGHNACFGRGDPSTECAANLFADEVISRLRL